MGRQFAYIGNDSSLLDLALARCGSSLTVEDVTGINGWGLGYYADERALIRKRPVDAVDGPVDLRGIASDIQSNSVIVHVRKGTRARATPTNTQPFRFRGWLCSHVGDAAGNDEIEKALRAKLPDFLERNLRGETDSEPALHLFFDHLRASARLDRPIVEISAVVAALRATVLDIDTVRKEHGIEAPAPLDMLYTSGRMICAVNRSASRMAWMKIEGVERVEQPLFAGHQPKTTQYDHFRGVFVAYDPAGSDGDWERVEPNHILVVDERGEVHVEPIHKSAE